MAQIDFTVSRLHSKPRGRPIEKCPKCGRKGERARYADGSMLFIHIGHIAGPFLSIDESCYVNRDVNV